MTEEEWFGTTDARRLLGLSRGKVSARKLGLFMVAWCRHNWERITLPATREAAQLAELFADGKASKKRLEGLFDECRRLTYGTPIGLLLWPDSAQMNDCVDRFCLDDFGFTLHRIDDQGATYRTQQVIRADIYRDIVGNPFHPTHFSPAWRTDTAVLLARQMYESRDFGAMPILADALQDAGCDNTDILAHCRDTTQVHVRGCWVVDLVLGKQ